MKTATTSKARKVAIEPTAIYRRKDLKSILSINDRDIAHEIRDGRLRVSVRAGRQFFIGKWVLQWIKRLSVA